MMKSRILICLLMSVFLAACATTRMQQQELAVLQRAQQAVAAAAADNQVRRYAGVELQKAQDALQAAQIAWTEEQNRARAEHLAYMALRHAQIAQAVAAEQAAVAQAKQLMERREALRLRAHSQELEKKERRIQELKEQLAEFKPKQTEQGIVLTLGDIQFAFDSAELSPAAEDPLNRLAAFLREHPSYRLRIEGYTDSIGSKAYNQRLSEARAQAVADALIARGIAPERMAVVGYGEAEPVAPNSTEAGRARNRRVELVILGAKSGPDTPEVSAEPESNVL